MYKVEFTESAVKQLKKLDKQTVRVIKNWVIKNLVNTPDPRPVSYTHLTLPTNREV